MVERWYTEVLASAAAGAENSSPNTGVESLEARVAATAPLAELNIGEAYRQASDLYRIAVLRHDPAFLDRASEAMQHARKKDRMLWVFQRPRPLFDRQEAAIQNLRNEWKNGQ